MRILYLLFLCSRYTDVFIQSKPDEDVLATARDQLETRHSILTVTIECWLTFIMN
jgi:hypothetical protein